MRLARAWRALEPDQRLAAAASLALLVTMFLPWYELQSLDRKTGVIHSHSINAFGDVSFVEAAIFLVAIGVLGMLWARAERRDFHMPGSDGTIVMVAGGWAALLIFYRVFSRPAGDGYPVGIQWGFFLAFVAAGALGYAGWRMRAARAPEPPAMRRRPRRPPPHEPPHDLPQPHEPPRDRPQPHEPPHEDVTVVAPSPPRPRPAAPVPARQPKRPRYPPAPPDQLSFEDSETEKR